MIVTASRLLFLGDETTSPNTARDPDWAVSVARDILNFDAICTRLGEFYDEADRVTTGLGRRGRYVDGDRSVLCLFRDKARWIRNWYLARTRPGTELFPGTYPHTSGRGSVSGDVSAASKDGAGGKTSAPSAPGGGSNIPTGQGGQAMDLDYGGLHGQFMMPGELDDSFWQAMLDMHGGMAWLDAQA